MVLLAVLTTWGAAPQTELETFETKIAWQQANEPESYRSFRERLLAAFNSPDRSELSGLLTPDYGKAEGFLDFVEGLKSEHGQLELLRFRWLDSKKQSRTRQLLAVYHAEFEDGTWWEVRLGADDEGRLNRFIITDTNYNEDLPLYRSKTPLQLPFAAGEEWYVLWGGDTEELNYHVSSRAQKNALDLLIQHPASRQSFRTDGRTNDDYYAFDREIFAPCVGVVESVVNDVPDNAPGVMNPGRLTGNTVIIRTPQGEYLLMAHLREGSIGVSVGDRVAAGDLIGRCGNSGNSSEPHLHMHLMDRPDLVDATGIQMLFQHVVVNETAKASDYAPIRSNRIATE